MGGRRESGGKPETRRALGRRRDEALFPSAPSRADVPGGYANALREIKDRIGQERLRVVMSANSAMVLLYWDLGRMILDRQNRAGWGAKVIDRLAADLRAAFPAMKGFSSRNLKYMKFFAQMCPSGLIGQQPAAQLPWFHLVTLLTKVSADTEREWYAAQVIQHGWSRPTPHAQLAIEANLKEFGNGE